MNKVLLILPSLMLVVATPCVAEFRLTPVLQSNDEAALMEETQTHCDDMAKRVLQTAYSPEGSSYFDLLNRCRELRRYLSDLAAMALIADMSKESHSDNAYNVLVESFVKKYNDLFEWQVTFLDELVMDKRFSADFVVNAEKLKALNREVIRYNNKIITAINSK